MAVPLPNPAIGTPFLAAADADVVFADHNGLAGIGSEGIGVAGEDGADDLSLDPGFFFGDVGHCGIILAVG